MKEGTALLATLTAIIFAGQLSGDSVSFPPDIETASYYAEKCVEEAERRRSRHVR